MTGTDNVNYENRWYDMYRTDMLVRKNVKIMNNDKTKWPTAGSAVLIR